MGLVVLYAEFRVLVTTMRLANSIYKLAIFYTSYQLMGFECCHKRNISMFFTYAEQRKLLPSRK